MTLQETKMAIGKPSKLGKSTCKRSSTLDLNRVEEEMKEGEE